MRRNRRVLFQAPTGAGKTALASYMAGETSAKGQQVWFICHRAELVLQTSLTFRKFGIDHGFIAAGYPMNLRAGVQICSIDTLKNRITTLTPPKLAIMDEAHHCGAAGWARVNAWLFENGAYVIGLSATPKRLDGTGLDEHFDDIVLGPSVRWLMDNGHLSDYRMFCPDIPDIRAQAKKKFDDEAGKKMPPLTGNIIAHWQKYAQGMKTVGFAVNIAHSQHLTRAFLDAGIRAAHLDGGTDKAERKRIIQAYANDDLDVIFNVSLFGEGFDLSAIAQTDVTIDCLIDAQPTQSLSLVLQKDGRVLRPSKGKTAIILDHAGNALRHGFPDDEREWSLAGDDSGNKSTSAGGPPPPVICKGCFNAIRRPLPDTCPHCGKSMREEAKEIEVAEGDLREMDEKAKESLRAKMRREEDACKDIGALTALAMKRGLPNPSGWAIAKMGGRRFKR